MRPFFLLAFLLGLGTGQAAQPATIQQVEQGLRPARPFWQPPGHWAGMSLTDRMAFHHVPGVSVAVIDHGQVVWARGYGVLQAGQPAPVTPSTLFQAASISKAVTATAALRLVQSGQLGLDVPVNQTLRSWQLPENALTRQHPVTLRHLLAHTAGIGMPGYLGYPAGQALPTLRQVLDGQAPATSQPVRVERRPGQAYAYSGGGYEVLQLLMQDAAGTAFPDLMRRQVLAPLGMTRSGFTQPLPAALESQAAVAHQPNGTPLPGRWHTYPELAAAGLWSTPSDLARWLLALSGAAQKTPGAVLSPGVMDQMLTNHTPGLKGWQHAYGLGLTLHGHGPTLSFGHSGINQGFRAIAVMYPQTGQGAVIMTNGENGVPLYNELLESIAAAYHWPGHQAGWRGWPIALLGVLALCGGLLLVTRKRHQSKRRSII
ncbi:beta-lactamase family protein [Deinococcus sp. HMF7604]|uniref:serine hydrolase domain-containing protein n=1 Tax=Deinococcus betulae TaxID=2873312 RepID=UPI001CCA7C3E|nr:beta-lactamase family protein [Deinococcus betulae]